MAQPQKEIILGNYLKWSHFPLDCESMDYIQNNTKLLAVIAQIAGCDKLIIKGCTGSPRTEGYVYVRTGDDLVGEILYYPGGPGVRCSIATDNINIDTTANGETFANAYTKRTLVSGTTGTWAWSDFKALSEITNAALKAAVDGKAAANHNHDTAYAAKSHNHDTAYAAKSHNHDTAYAAKSHNHDTAYAAKNHNHDTAYAAKNHNHDERYYTEAEIDSMMTTKVNNNTSYNVYARRYGKVVTIHIKGYQPSHTSGYGYFTLTENQLPKRFWPEFETFAMSVESNTTGTGLSLGNMHIAWLTPGTSELKVGWMATANQTIHIHATFTYVLP